MGKKTVTTYTSESAEHERRAKAKALGVGAVAAPALMVHHCRFTGEPVIMLSQALSRIPRRQRDGALCIELATTDGEVAKLYAKTDPKPRYVRLRDANGRVEQRHEVYVNVPTDGIGAGVASTVPVGYRETVDSLRVFLFADALEANVSTSFSDAPLDAHPSQKRVRSGEGWEDVYERRAKASRLS